jgi:hypothetical protein
MQRVPYSHNNQSLALALHIAGFPIIHVERQYTLEDEQKYGLRARDLAAKDVGGALYFYHAWDDDLPAMVEAYDKAAKMDGFETESDITREDVVMIVAQCLKSRRDIAAIVRSSKIATLVKSKGEAITTKTEDGGAILKHPGFIKISDTDELRERTGIDR